MKPAPETTGAASQRYAGGDPKNADCLAAVGDNNTPDNLDLQRRLRVGWLSRRFALNPTVAAAVAALAFSVPEVR